jgi:translocator protein
MTNAASGASGARATTADTARQGAVIAALAATLTVNTLANTLPINGQNTGEISDRFPLLITPPGYVFGIWGLIYSGMIAYAVYQALPSRRASARLRRIALPFIASCAANSAWIMLWHYNQTALSVPVMLGLLGSLIVIDRRIGRADQLPADDLAFARLPFSLYLGWISVATIVNITVALYDAGWDGFGAPPELWTAGLLATAGGLAAAMGLSEGDVPFPLVVAWAGAGIASKNAELPLVATTAWGATAVGVLAAGAALLRWRRG